MHLTAEGRRLDAVVVVPALVALCGKRTMSTHYYGNMPYFNLWERCIIKALLKSCLHRVAMTLHEGNERVQQTRVKNTLWYAPCAKNNV